MYMVGGIGLPSTWLDQSAGVVVKESRR